MYYHASPVKDIKILEPRVSNHNIPLIYFSSKRENALVYLSNAVEKFCQENNFLYDGIYSKWGSYSFNKTGIIQLEEYYPNALYETYKGVSGYIYRINSIPNVDKLKDIPYAYISSTNIPIDSIEYIPDAYEAIMKEIKAKKMILIKYDQFIKMKKEWLEKIIKKEYEEAFDHPEYRFFLKSKFPFLQMKNIT